MAPLAPGRFSTKNVLAEAFGELLRDEPRDHVGRAAGG